MERRHEGKITADQSQRRSKSYNQQQREDEPDLFEIQRAALHPVASRDAAQTDAAFQLPNTLFSNALDFGLRQQDRAAIAPSLTTADLIRYQRAAGVRTESLHQQLLDLSVATRLAQTTSVGDCLYPNQNLLASSTASPLVGVRWLQNQIMTMGLRNENSPAIPFLAGANRLHLPLPCFQGNRATSALFQPSLDFQLASSALARLQQPINHQRPMNLQQTTRRHLFAEVASASKPPQNCNVLATAAGAPRPPQPDNGVAAVASTFRSPQKRKAEMSNSSTPGRSPQRHAAASLVSISTTTTTGKKPPKRRKKEAKESNATLILYTPDDVGKLSEQQLFLRQQIEYFRATNEELFSITRGKNKPIVLRQVGIRCLHCRHVPAGMRRKGSTYFPSNLMGIYQAAQNLSVEHLQSGLCPEVPLEVKAKLVRLVSNKKQIVSGAGKTYWAETGKMQGLVDTEDGIYFATDVSQTVNTES